MNFTLWGFDICVEHGMTQEIAEKVQADLLEAMKKYQLGDIGISAKPIKNFELTKHYELKS